MSSRKDRPVSPVYIKLICWLGPLASLLLAFYIELMHIEDAFAELSSQTFAEVESRVDMFELALEGFANFLAISGSDDDASIRVYVQGIRALYPELYMFEIATRVEHAQRQTFEQSMRSKGTTDFFIHTFDQISDRPPLPISKRSYYYPIRFLEPQSPATAQLMGLDIGNSTVELVSTLVRSLSSSRPMASRTFELLEGGKGYVIYRPVAVGSALQAGDQPMDVALLAIRTEDLLPRWLQSQDRYGVSFRYPQAAAGGETAPEEVVVTSTRDQAHNLPWYEFVALQRVGRIDNESKPFDLKLTTVVHGSDLNLLWLLIVTLSGSFLCFYLARYLCQHHHRKCVAHAQQQQLYRQANFDSLTDLPNLNLLLDRAEQAIRIADRANTKVGICYLDVDKFKSINDRWGHQVGDKALLEIAVRLKAKLRGQDTAARIHGDEFVILLPDVDDMASLQQVAAKIESVFAEPFMLAEQSLQIGCSLGVSLYPEDADELEALLHISDKRMYADKEVRDARVLGELMRQALV
ncbi:MAG: diguanylate cyclase [Motiliproteus sp.]